MDDSPAPIEDPSSDPNSAAAVAPVASVPAELWIDELNSEPLNGLLERAESLGLRLNTDRTRHQIVFELLRIYASRGTTLFADGILELAPQGSGFLRWGRFNFRSLPQD